MLPDRALNIYPRNDENIQALINYYFAGYNFIQEGAMQKVNEYPLITLNQWEFIFQKILQAYEPVFQRHLNGQITLANLITYGVEGTSIPEPRIHGSRNRLMITKAFRDFVIGSQNNSTSFGN